MQLGLYDSRTTYLLSCATTTRYRYSDLGERFWKQTGTGVATYYALDGTTTLGAFTEAGTLRQ